jgi:hypothetical protein
MRLESVSSFDVIKVMAALRAEFSLALALDGVSSLVSSAESVLYSGRVFADAHSSFSPSEPPVSGADSFQAPRRPGRARAWRAPRHLRRS